jgi:hypothetical protein
MLRNQFFALTVGALVFLFSTSCNRQPRPEPKVESKPSPSPSTEITQRTDPGQSVVDCIKQIPFLEPGETSGLLKAWKEHPTYKNYRMVEASDFRIPDWTSHEYYARDVERATGWSHDYGELGGAYGLVIFMIDKTMPLPNCFSVAVLIRRPANRFDLYWIFENADLTHFTMGRHSGDVYLERYDEDGKTHVCDIQYSRNHKRWACEFYT